MNTSRLYSIVAAAVVVAILLLGWFGLVSPQLQQIALAQEQVTSANAQNDVLTQTLATLKDESDRLPELTDELDALRLQIPETAQVDVFVRELQSLAAANGVDIVGLTVPEATLYPAAAAATAAAPATDPSAQATPAPAPTDLTTPTATTTTTAPSTDVQPSAALAPNLYTINFTLSVTGPGDGIVSFLKAVQTGGRIFLVTSVSLNTQAADALGTASISGYVFIVSTPASRAAAVTATPTPAPTPTATPTPTPTPTASPTADPTPAPTPSPTETPAG